MKACIFLGPTLPAAVARAELDAVLLPPAQRGDVYEAVTLLRPSAMGLIDGYFQWAPAVWHKEILWAIAQGVAVFGAASMGALRAAELAPFGMRGVGRVFEAYRDGVLAAADDGPFEDDDEVAVVHGPAELGYPAASEAMVNIRLTLASAQRDGVIGGATAAALCAIAKGTFFPDRSYAALLAASRQRGLPEAELQAFEQWLGHGAIDQKRSDALMLLRTMRSWVGAEKRASRADFVFEHTTFWQQLVARHQARPALAAHDALALAELRLEPRAWQVLRERVIGELARAGDQGGSPPEPGSPTPSLDEARAQRSHAALLDQLPMPLVERWMLQALKAEGRFEPLRDRGEAKRRCLAGSCVDAETLSEHQRLELTDWFFTTLAGAEIPDDMAAWLDSAGYADEGAFHGAIFDEFRFRQAAPGAAGA